MRDDRMINDNYYVYKKEVDWSVLQQGVSIPVTIQVVFQTTINKFLQEVSLKTFIWYWKERLIRQGL